MKSRMENIVERWSNGETTPYGLSPDEKLALFSDRSPRPVCVAIEWDCDGKHHAMPRGWTIPLPDLSGIAIGGARNGVKGDLIVINADGTERFRLRDPVVVPNEPQLCGAVHLELPRMGWPAGHIPFGPIACFESRRAFPVMLELNWETGEVLGADQLPRFF